MSAPVAPLRPLAVTVKYAAKMLQCSERQVYRLIEAKVIPARSLSTELEARRALRISYAWLERWVGSEAAASALDT